MIPKAREMWVLAEGRPVRMYATALGPPSAEFVDAAHERGAVVGRLAIDTFELTEGVNGG